MQDWLDKHDDWDKPDEIAEATGATHVIFIDVHKYNLFEENSHELFRGRAEVLVSVFKMQKGDQGGEEVWDTKEIMRCIHSLSRTTPPVPATTGFGAQYLGQCERGNRPPVLRVLQRRRHGRRDLTLTLERIFRNSEATSGLSGLQLGSDSVY